MDEDMLNRAIKMRYMNFLYCVYAFNKNYEYSGVTLESQLAGDEDSPSHSDETFDDEDDHY